MELSKYFSKDWYDQLKDYLSSSEFKEIGWKIAAERKKKKIYPEKGEDTFLKVFRVTPLEKVKVVIIGQDPYHDGSFDGLAFSNRESKVRPSPSLKRILTEVERDVYNNFNLNTTSNISLYRWAEQGVLLLNTAHTVVSGSPGSHLHYWREFTKEVVNAVCHKRDNVVWLLWGSHAHKIEQYITNKTHVIIKSGHPSPLNTTNPFKGCGCFSMCNKELEKRGLTPITW